MKKFNRTIDIGRVKELLSYNPETGVFTWLQSKGNGSPDVGEEAGSITPEGRRNIGIDRIRFMAHRVAWAYVHGRWPVGVIDHINGNPLDNRICNLREATVQQNCFNQKRHRNSATKYVGVSFHKKRNSWRARLGQRHLGWFATEEAAHEHYLAEFRKLSERFSVPVHPSSAYI